MIVTDVQAPPGAPTTTVGASGVFFWACVYFRWDRAMGARRLGDPFRSVYATAGVRSSVSTMWFITFSAWKRPFSMNHRLVSQPPQMVPAR